MESQFQFSGKLKQISLILIGVGVLSLVAQLVSFEGARVWSNLLLNGIFFLAMGLVGAFFISVSHLANAGWMIAIKRVLEGVMHNIPVMGFLALVAVGMGVFGHFYHWTHTDLYADDAVLAGKSGYLNVPFFMGRAVVYVAVWSLLAWLLRKNSLRDDVETGTAALKQSVTYSAIFLVFFAVTSSTMSWDWIMSIDTHWYSTLFGWYVFSSMFVTGLAMITLIVIWMKNAGYLEYVNKEHIHDLGKFVFAFSVFWTYLWFSQFLLIWYANVPEETIYYALRFEHYKPLFFGTFVINFIAPFLILMTRDAKRQTTTLAFVCLLIILGHWFDFYLMIFPGVGHHAPGGEAHWWPHFYEFGLTAGYLGLFMYVTYSAIAKAPLVPKNHPYLEESINHQT